MHMLQAIAGPEEGDGERDEHTAGFPFPPRMRERTANAPRFSSRGASKMAALRLAHRGKRMRP
jgi:hypothetical protein